MGQSSVLPVDSFSIDKQWKLIIVKAQFNQSITDKLLKSSYSRLESLGVLPSQIHVISVAGALEIPLTIDWAFANGFDGAIALGAVIRGETTHYEFVCTGVERGCMSVQLEHKKPIVQAVLTTENIEQALNRCGGAHGDKGSESAEVLVSMLNIKNKLHKQLKQ